MENIDIKEIYENAMEDPTLFSTIDIDELLKKIENEDNHYLENKTPAIIAKEIFDIFQELSIEDDICANYCERLTGYRLIERICDLRNGVNMRWIKKTETYTEKSLTNGGILTNIKITDKGVQLLCMTPNRRRFFNILYDECIVFQKLSMEEQFILMSHEYI